MPERSCRERSAGRTVDVGNDTPVLAGRQSSYSGYSWLAQHMYRVVMQNHIADDGSSVGSSMPNVHTRWCSIAIKDTEGLARPWLSWLMAAKPNSRIGVR